MEADFRGLSCPIPVMKAKKILKENREEGIFYFLVDSGAPADNISRLAVKLGCKVESAVKSDGVELKVVCEEGRDR